MIFLSKNMCCLSDISLWLTSNQVQYSQNEAFYLRQPKRSSEIFLMTGITILHILQIWNMNFMIFSLELLSPHITVSKILSGAFLFCMHVDDAAHPCKSLHVVKNMTGHF